MIKSCYDIEAAHRGGVRVISLRSGGWNDAALAKADVIYDDPADLLQRFDESLLGGTAVRAMEAQ